MSDGLVRIALTTSKLILKNRWMLAAMVSALVIWVEIEEHRPIQLNALEPDFLREMIIFGFILPILTGLLLSILAYTENERARAVYSLDQRNMIAQELNTASNWDALIEKIVTFPRSVAPIINTSLHLNNPEFDRFELIADWSSDRKSRAMLRPILTPELCQGCEINLLEPESKANLVLCKQLTSLNPDFDKYCLPLIHHDHSVALLHLDVAKGMAITSNQMRVLNSVAHEMAMAIDGARTQNPFETQTQATEAERKRIAQNLHDTLGQNISFLRLKLDQLTGDDVLLEISMIRQELELMREIAEDAYEQIRGTLADLNQNSSADLSKALFEHAQSIGKRAGFEVNLTEKGHPIPLPADYKRQILFIAREAINNIEKHAHAEHVDIELLWKKTDLSICIRDDGGGFDLSNASSSAFFGDHYGLKIMQERAEDIQGCLTVDALPGLGTQVKLWLPLTQKV
jgi:two-component system, NarL family, nitrate/nitrite sensor histidine kinase NarX